MFTNMIVSRQFILKKKQEKNSKNAFFPNNVHWFRIEPKNGSFCPTPDGAHLAFLDKICLTGFIKFSHYKLSKSHFNYQALKKN